MTRKMPDLISRDAAKELLDELRWSLDQDGEIAGAEAIEEAIRTIDAIPADEPDNRWELAWRELYNWLWDSNVKQSGRVIDYMNRLEVDRNLPGGKPYAKHVCDNLSIPAAEGEGKPESHAESVPQDPAILRQVCKILAERGFPQYAKYLSAGNPNQ